MSTFRDYFGPALRARRLGCGLSMSETCRRAAVLAGLPFHVTVLTRWERGESMPSIEQAVYLAKVLRMPLRAFMVPPDRGPWIDGSYETLLDLDEQIAGIIYREHIDQSTGLRSTLELRDYSIATLEELPEIGEEIR